MFPFLARRASGLVLALIIGGAAGLASPLAGEESPEAPSFRNDILPILSKAGCNGGGCHGALAGKGGFRLSLFGYDPRADHEAITRESLGRRIELADPGRSLLLTKPTLVLPHKGGRRLDPESEMAATLGRWISAGAPGPRDDDPRLERLEVTPAETRRAPGESYQLRVHAHYSDGSRDDVTALVRYTSAVATVAEVDSKGHVKVIGPGTGALTAWFSSRIAIARVTAPYPGEVDPAVFEKEPVENFIDELVLGKLKDLRLPPSPRADDYTLVRRAYLDTIGRLPRPDELRSHVEDRRPDRHERLVDHLLGREEFVDYWAYRLSDIFLVTGTKLRPEAVRAYYQWIRSRVADGTHWDDLVREVLTAKGSSIEQGATNFYAVHQAPESMAENVSQAFLSLSINCARCHNHPLEKWTNDQYYAFANLFARVRAKGWGGDPRNGDGRRTLYVDDRGDLIQPTTGKPRPPAPLDAEPLPFDSPGDRREALADWLTAPDNPYFARAITNRIWAAFLGVGLVEPVDDLRVSNPASNPELLDRLSAYLVEKDFDLRALMRLILESGTYRRSSEALPANAADDRHFATYPPRRLMAEVLADAISDVTGVSEKYTLIANKDGSTSKTDFYPPGTRALELYDSAVKSSFLKTFGRNPRQITCECERSDQPSLVQALHLSNGSTINDKLGAKKNRISELLERFPETDALIRELWLVCLSRPPKDEELQRIRKVVEEASPSERREVIEDICWSLLTSREFLFQH